LLVVFIPSSLLVSPDVTTGRSAGGEFDNSLVLIAVARPGPIEQGWSPPTAIRAWRAGRSGR